MAHHRKAHDEHHMEHRRGEHEKREEHKIAGMGRHHRRASGGSVGMVDEDKDGSTRGMEVYAGKGSNVVKEAEKRKRGGAVHKKHPMHVEGGKAHHHRLDRPGRKRGGAVGADKSPLTEAARLSPAKGDKAGYKLDSSDD